MAGKHYIVPQIPVTRVTAVRLGAGNAANQRLKTGYDEGKLVKLAGTDRYDFCAVGDPIEGVITSVENATTDGYSIGGIKQDERFFAEAEGSQAAGTGAIAVGDYVVAGTVPALNTAQTGYPKVRKATDQAAAKAAPFAWRVVSLYKANTGAVGTDIVVERVC